MRIINRNVHDTESVTALEKAKIMTVDNDDGVKGFRYKTIPTGFPNLDDALSIGGLPIGHIIEICGPESSGKTTLALHLIAQAQGRKLVCAFIDSEHTLDIVYARACGVDPGKLLVSQPDCGEQALDIADSLARTGSVGLIVVDSAAALIPKAELEGDVVDHHAGLQARLMSRAMRKLSGVASQTNTVIVFVNQLRQKIGESFGSPEITAVERALRHDASVRLDIRRIATLKDGDRTIGSRARVRVAKDECTAPSGPGPEVEIVFEYEIDRDQGV